ncbi:MAG: peptide chain release factor N(5)-glutamine methyltransferase [Cellulomonas sp.]|nr:peptide chain release factor N(5)-glutamine methyltransferase [Cellulomonas sp.]
MPEDTGPGLTAMVTAATQLLTQAGVPSPRHDAVAIAAHLLGLPTLSLVTAGPPPDGFARSYAEAVDRRRRREPLQHIVGSTAFRYVTLLVEPGVFVPRPETEVLAGLAVDEVRALAAGGLAPLVVDLCCGAGPIGVSVAVETSATVVMVDRSTQAVDLAARNARACDRPQVSAVVGDVRDPQLLSELTGRVDVLTANPPYIPPDAEPVDPEVRDHDPDLALYGGGVDGLDLPRAVLQAAARLLRPGGLLLMEHAEVQAQAVRADAAATAGFIGIRTEPDLTGRPRLLVARRTAGTGSAA